MDLPLEYQIVAILHDTIEDTTAIWFEIAEKFGLDIADAVHFISKVEEDILDYIKAKEG